MGHLDSKAIAERTFPGGAVAFGSCTVPCYYQAYGTYTFESSSAISPESQWDMASLTKIMATVPSIMILYDRGQIALDEVACKYLPDFEKNGKEFITIRQLLTHTAGLREF
jgi:CubicO group peptidase (beta-lactamase class C family)